MISDDLIDPQKKLKTLKHDAIDRVYRIEVKNEIRSLINRSMYGERPSPYKVVLKGEKRKRRVYVTPIGNASVFYLKVQGEFIYCEVAMDEALYRV